MDLDFTLARIVWVGNGLGLEIDFHLEIVEEDLFLLSDSDRCMSFNGLDLIELNQNILFGDLKLADLFSEVLLGEFGEILLLVEPRVVVPDRAEAFCLFLLHFVQVCGKIV